MAETRKPIRRILTGIRPTGKLHLGHYVGALSMWAELQAEDYDCYFLLADVQALTTHAKEPGLIEEAVKEVTLDMLGVGLDPTRPNVHFVVQSWVRELPELYTYLSMVAPFSDVRRNPTLKDEMAAIEKGVVSLSEVKKTTLGFIDYPISQVADIELFTPPAPFEKNDELLVPVGQDQVPHVELTNRTIRNFNATYGEVFLEAKYRITKFPRLVGTDGQAKMSKSLGNVIQLADPTEVVNKKVAVMFTDPQKIHATDPGHPEKCPVYLYHQAFAKESEKIRPLSERASQCREGKLGCVECKKELAKTLNNFLDPIRTRRAEAEKMPLRKILEKGTAQAREVGGQTLSAVRKAMHLDYPQVQ
ncbi:MAG: tryptophan--tRNA ligase [bacterium]|nr:tryptophan--tRNA ligase [bacterium]